MANTLQKFFLSVLLLLVASLACNFPSTDPAISAAWMARDYDGAIPTSVYTPDDIFYCIATFESSGAESTVSAIWTAVNASSIEPNLAIDQVEVTTGSGTIHFELINANPWPVGTYTVDLFLNGVLDRTLGFTVQ